MSKPANLHFQLLTSWFPSKEENARFDIENVCMTAFLKRLSLEMGIVLPKPWRKVNICYGPDQRDNFTYGDAPRFTLESMRDIRDFFSLDDLERRKYACGLMRDALAFIAPILGDDPHRFEPLFLEMEQSRFRNRFLWKRKTSRNRDRAVSVFVEYTSESIEVSAVVSPKDGSDGAERTVKRIRPNEFAIHEMLGEIKFDRTLGPVLLSRSGRDVVPLTGEIDGL